MQKLIKNDKILLYKVIEKNIKHSYIKPQDGYVLITKSKHMPLERITNRLLDKFDYYLESTKKIKEDILYVWNKPYRLIVNEGKIFSYQIVDDVIIVNSKDNKYLNIKVRILKEELKNYLLSIKDEVLEKLHKNNYYEVPLKLKYLRSKYGSYNINKKKEEYIVLNVYLATLEKEFTLYVLYHEYAHQKVKNHQKDFYKGLNKLYKDHREYQKKIKKKRLNIWYFMIL